MNLFRILIAMLPLLAATARAGFELPAHVYRMPDLDKAMADARERNLPVTFVYSREETDCGLCTQASTTVMDELRKRSVIVYAHSNRDWGSIPGIVQNALTSPEAGKYIPKTVVVKPDLSEIVACIPYARGKEFAQSIKDAEDLIRDKVAGASSNPEAPVPAVSREQAREARVWRSVSGAEVEARLVRRTGYTVVLEKADGTQLRINLQQLSPEDRNVIAASGL